MTLAAQAGLSGCCIEDARIGREPPVYDAVLAGERIAACVEAARAAGSPFTLTARAENFIRGNPDLDDTLERLARYQAAGADVLMAPGLPDLAAVRTVCGAMDRTFSFMVGIPGRSFSQPELEAAGVRRISLATALYRAAMAALMAAAGEARSGRFGFVDTGADSRTLAGYMGG